MRAKLLSSLSPTPALYLPKFAVLHIEDAILHRALHGPRAAPAVSARLWDWGRQRHRNVIAAEVTVWGRLPSLRLPLFGVWDEGQRLGHGRCPSALPLAAGQRGRTHAARAREALRGAPDASAVRPARLQQGSLGGNGNSHELRMHGTRYRGMGVRLRGSGGQCVRPWTHHWAGGAASGASSSPWVPPPACPAPLSSVLLHTPPPRAGVRAENSPKTRLQQRRRAPLVQGWVCILECEPRLTGKQNPGGLEVHGAVCQVVLAADVADLLGLHRLQLGAVGDAMAQAAAESTAAFPCNGRNGVRQSHPTSKGALPAARVPPSALQKFPVRSRALSPPISSMVSSPQCSTCSTGGTFCFASRSSAFRSMSTDSSGGRDGGQMEPQQEPDPTDPREFP